MRHKPLDLIVVLLIAALNVGWALLPNHLPLVGIILALPLVFLLPGYALTEALFKSTSDDAKSLVVKPPARIIGSFPFLNRLVFSLGLSLVIDIITGLVLNTLLVGLQQSSWAVALVFLTTIFALVALYRRREVGGQQSKRSGLTRPRFRRLSLYEFALFALALAITASCVWYSAVSAAQQEQQTSYTQFWMVPSKQANDSCAALIGVRSFEASPTTYRVVLTANGTLLFMSSSVVVSPNNQWYQSVPITSSNSGTVTLEALLYRADQPQTIYRETHLTLTSSGEGNNGKLQC